ncbi:isoleucine--tRNA ligase [bacterium]|nr:isoleucine--tRNA ligase [bacterium]
MHFIYPKRKIMDYRSTLNLPNTKFPMRANLPKREPDILKKWDSVDIYHKIVENRKDIPLFALHDGPPYANGDVHLGTGLNKILKDIVNKSKLLLGYNINYRPGWDCHGLPIERNVSTGLSEEEKETIETLEIRRRCRNFALKFVDKQRKSFKRLGVIGDWERPYITLAPEYEAEELRLFAEFVKKGLVYQGLKPIYWCADCTTALAEAEVEYDSHTSPSIYVRFPLAEEGRQKIREICPHAEQKPISAVIWTTTPWTLPANRAVCLHPNFIYTLVPVGDEYLLIAKDLVERFLEDSGLEKTGDTQGAITGNELEEQQLHMRHPLADITVPMITGTHVTLEQGTGCVHTAPGHGHEDYIVGLEYGLEVYSPVNAKGELNEQSPVCQGTLVHDANKPIIKILTEKGVLLSAKEYEHSYPHCWRCKQPIIYRATRQWFISLEKEGLREQLLEAIDKVNWVPSWGYQRIRGMLENRAEWCISRQRAWGVPIPAVYIGEEEDGILDAELIKELADIVAKEGTNFWYKAMQDPEERKKLTKLEKLLPAGKTLDDLHLETDILDVWFDSGASHQSVMKADENVFPVDLYLEGSDQHRGWFQSSLVTAIAAGLEPPFKTVLTHGFTVDEHGRKLSKSLGNFVNLDDLIKNLGADIIRLWVGAEDFRVDMSFSEDILKRMTESYRRIRNTIRFLLGNIADFDPSRSLPEGERLSLDRWILMRWRESKKRIIQSYERYDFHRIFYDLNNFCSVDLSAQYLDIIKDRMYVSGPQSQDRLSAQSTMAEIAVELTACVAPILSFTGEEIWDYLREYNLTDKESVFHYILDLDVPESDAQALEYWDKVFVLRAEVIKIIESARQAGTIGHSLDCQVILDTSDPTWRAIIEQTINQKRGDDLGSILIVSAVKLGTIDASQQASESPLIPGVKVWVEKAPGDKCPRCWHYHEQVGKEGHELCPRCEGVLESEGISVTE